MSWFKRAEKKRPIVEVLYRNGVIVHVKSGGDVDLRQVNLAKSGGGLIPWEELVCKASKSMDAAGRKIAKLEKQLKRTHERVRKEMKAGQELGKAYLKLREEQVEACAKSHEMTTCSAKRRNGERCQMKAVPRPQFCKHHGGSQTELTPQPPLGWDLPDEVPILYGHTTDAKPIARLHHEEIILVMAWLRGDGALPMCLVQAVEESRRAMHEEQIKHTHSPKQPVNVTINAVDQDDVIKKFQENRDEFRRLMKTQCAWPNYAVSEQARRDSLTHSDACICEPCMARKA